MMIGNNEEYIQAYTEVYCILKYFPKEFLNKLPAKLLYMIQSKSNEKYKIKVDVKRNLLNQNLSKKARDILVVLKYNFWSNEDEKEKLKKKFHENETKFQNELSEKYNTDNIFKNKDLNTKIETNIENVSMIEYKESWINKIMKKIQNVINKVIRK